MARIHYLYPKNLDFPNPNNAAEDGLLAVGGDLSSERLLSAYAQGIFPWPIDEERPVCWYSPNPRTVLLPQALHISKSLKKVLRKRIFEVRFDTAFDHVIWSCATIKRKENMGTWITPEMIEAYCRLHKLGFAHSAEAWMDGKLFGGVYGVSLGAAFFGESMFTKCNNASKVALVTLLCKIHEWGFHFLDCQIHTNFVETLGAVQWSRKCFLKSLNEALKSPNLIGKWILEEGFSPI